ncbi:hypothetical protein PUN28_011688 [Cardiocondyla obscurior]|uniref:Uncharacterized protein n=1 Tax=Cardiocondyla obscurior TaxID=286306 RepID=A0AAW2FKM2_9HYME
MLTSDYIIHVVRIDTREGKMVEDYSSSTHKQTRCIINAYMYSCTYTFSLSLSLSLSSLFLFAFSFKVDNFVCLHPRSIELGQDSASIAKLQHIGSDAF